MPNKLGTVLGFLGNRNDSTGVGQICHYWVLGP